MRLRVRKGILGRKTTAAAARLSNVIPVDVRVQGCPQDPGSDHARLLTDVTTAAREGSFSQSRRSSVDAFKGVALAIPVAFATQSEGHRVISIGVFLAQAMETPVVETNPFHVAVLGSSCARRLEALRTARIHCRFFSRQANPMIRRLGASDQRPCGFLAYRST